YDLIENITAHHNNWDTSAYRGESSSSITSSSSKITALTQQMAKMRKDMLQMYRLNQQVNSVTPSCETCGGPHSYYECQAAGGYTQDVYATSRTCNAGGNSYQLQAEIPRTRTKTDTIKTKIGYPSTDEMLRNFMISTEAKFNSLATSVSRIEKSLQERPRGGRTRLKYDHGLDTPRKYHKRPTSDSPAVSCFWISDLHPAPFTSFVIPERNPHQPKIPYPSRLNKEKLQDKSDIQIQSFLQMFNKLHFNISFLEAFASDLGASINLIPLSVWEKLTLPELTPTRMTLKLATRTVAYPIDIAEDVFVKVGKFTFLADFVLIDYDVDPRVPLILGRPFLRTAHALVDVYGEELTLYVGDGKLVFNVERTLRYPQKHGDE
ncbi:reverse transcriptase domain-containing protein, partial [Tanacetum coccineum]